MAGKNSKASKQAREFATLYVNGPPGLKDNWMAVEAHLKRAVDSQDPLVREAIYTEGGAVPDKMPSAPTSTEEFELDLSEFDEKLASAETEEDWKALAKELRPTMMGIADGSIKANAAQTAIIKHILDRGYGRLGTKDKQQLTPSGVLILPTLGERSDMKVCPRCKYEMEQKYPKEVVKDAE